jgi:hypothetical protein
MEITKLKTLFWKLKDQIKQPFSDFDDAAFISDGRARPLDNPDDQIVRISS